MSTTYLTTSWDDGHPADLRVAELLHRYGLAGTFYVPRKIETGVMDDAQIHQLAQSFEVGAHTLNHVFLTGADDQTARLEISASKSWVEETTGRACRMFCPPGGKFAPRHAAMFHEAGFDGIRTVEFMSLDFPRPRSSGLVEMPTTIQAFPQTTWNYAKNLAKRAAVRNVWLYLTRGRSNDWTAAAVSLLKRAVETGGVFHLWGHSWEIEQQSQWKELEDVLKVMGQFASGAPCLTNGQVCERAVASRTEVREAMA